MNTQKSTLRKIRGISINILVLTLKLGVQGLKIQEILKSMNSSYFYLTDGWEWNKESKFCEITTLSKSCLVAWSRLNDLLTGATEVTENIVTMAGN